MRSALLCLFAATGCVATPKPPLAVPTAVRSDYPDAVWPALSQALDAEGYESTLLSSSRLTHGKSNAEENTERDDLTYIFRTSRGGIDAPLVAIDAAKVLTRMKSSFRRAVNAVEQSEVTGTSEDEAYQERSVKVRYRIDDVNGAATFKWTPYTAEGELVNRLEIVFREQEPPAR